MAKWLFNCDWEFGIVCEWIIPSFFFNIFELATSASWGVIFSRLSYPLETFFNLILLLLSLSFVLIFVLFHILCYIFKKILNDVITYLLCDNIYIIIFVKLLNNKINPFYFIFIFLKWTQTILDFVW